MADPKIKIRRSATPNKVPSKDQLQLGELAINTYDGKLYLEQDQGGVGVGNTVIAVNPWGVGIGSTAYNTQFTAGKVGVGTTNAQYNLDVGGDINFTGNLYQDGSAFTSGVGIRTAGGTVGWAATIIDFRGPGVTTAYYSSSTGIGTVYFQGGGGGGGSNASVTVSDSAPSSPSNGDLWFKSDVGELYLWYTDGSSNQWVEASGGSNTVITSDTAPSSPQDGDLWWNSDTGELKVYYNDGNSSQWVDANSEGGFVQYWTQTNTNGNLGVTTTGFVGIGTTTATDALTVSGNVNVTGVSTFTGGANVPDSSSGAAALNLGNNKDLKIYHTGNHSIIKNGTGNLILQDDNNIVLEKNDGTNMLVAAGDGSVELYEAGDKKFETTLTGASVTGDLAASGNVTGVAATFTGNVTVGGVLTYEDVKNVDAIGVVTARTGIKVLAGGANVVDGTTTDELNVTGVATAVQLNATTLNVSGVSTFAGHVGTSATVGIGSTAYAHKFALLDAGTNGGKDAAAIGSSGKNLRFWGTGGSAGIWGSTGLKIAGNGATADTPVDTNVHLHLLSGQNTKFKMEASGYSSLELVANQGGSGVQNHIQSNKPILFFTGPSSGLTTAFRIGEDEGSTFYHPLEFRHPYATHPGGTRTIVMEPVSGIITATKFKGDGSELTGVISGIGIGTEGGVVGYAATIVHFKGAGVTTAYYSSATGIGTINFHSATTGGGGANVTVSDTPPGSPSAGDLWWESDIGELKIYYSDGDSAQWVDASGADSLVQIGTSAPTGAVSGDLWFNSETGDFMVYYTDANSSAWVSVNAVNSNTKWITNATGIHTSSYVGIGTTTVTDALTVVGATDLDGTLLVSGITTFGSHVYHGDNDRDIYGDGSDLQIFHNALDSHIDNNTGNLILRTNVTSDVGGNIKLMPKASQNGIIITHDASVELYEAGNKKFETTNTGVSITGNNVVSGNVTAVDGTFSGDLDVDGHTNLDNVSIAGVTTFANTARFSGDVNIVGTLTYEDVKNVDSIGIITARAGVKVLGSEGGNAEIEIFGDEGDDNNDKWKLMTNANANFYLQNYGAGSWQNSILARPTGATELYNTGNLKLATTTTGVDVTGIVKSVSDGSAGVVLHRTFSGNVASSAVNTPQIDFTLTDTATSNQVVAKISPQALAGTGDAFKGLLRFFTANDAGTSTERLRIDSDGRLMVGTTTPGNSSADDLTLHNSGNCGVTIRAGNSSNSYVFFADGTSSDEPYRGFISYFHNGDFFKFGTAGAERLRITSDGNLGLGVDSPVARLHVHNAGTGSGDHAYAYFTTGDTGSDASSGLTIGVAANQVATVNYREAGVLSFGTSSTERLRIDSDGRLLAGTTTEGHGNADDLTIATTDHTGITLRSATNRNGSVFFSDGTSGADEYRGWIQYTHTSDYLTFGTNGGERLRITSAGDLGLGTNSPDRQLHIRGAAPIIRLDDTGGGYSEISANTAILSLRADQGNTQSSSYINFQVDGTERLRITSDGKVGINETSPDRALHVKTTTDTEQIYVENTASSGRAQVRFVNPHGDWVTGLIGGTTDGDFITYTSAAKNFRVYTNNAERFRIKSDGAFSLTSENTTGWLLKAGQDSSSYSAIDGHFATTNRTLYLNQETSHRSFVVWNKNGSDGYGFGLDSSGNFKVVRGTNERLRINSDGEVGIGENNPTRRLHVASDDDLTTFTGGSYGTFAIENSQWDNGDYTAMDFLYNGSAKAVSRIASKITSSGASLHFGVSNNYSTGITHEAMVIDYTGNLLINSTSNNGASNAGQTPVLYANGYCNFGGLRVKGGDDGNTIYKDGGDLCIVTASAHNIILKANGGTSFTINSSGNMLVNTSSSHAAKHAIHSGSTVGCAEFASALGGAGAACQVNVRVNTSASQGLYIRQGGSSQTIAGGNHAARFWNSENARMQFGVNNTERFRIESNGDLKATDTSIGSLSDSRLKKNIVDFTYDLTKFKQFKPRTFDWINPELHTDKTGIRGFVAQEIETVDSVLVGDYELFDETEDTKNPDLEIIKADDGTNKAKDAKLGSNDAMYISVIQQLITKIETLETKVAALEGS